MTVIIAGVVALVVGVGIGLLVNAIVSTRMRSDEVRVAKLVSDAEFEPQGELRSALLEVKEQITAMRREAEDDVRIRRDESKRNEESLGRREQTLEERTAQIAERERELEPSQAEGDRQSTASKSTGGSLSTSVA